MFSVSKFFAKSNRLLASSGAVLLISAAMISNAGAADIAASYDSSCAACHDSGALNAIKKAIVPNGNSLSNKRYASF